ncbi:hypothetical protein K7432_009382 [Basidiobolus ranarum]|uniref:G-protein coupled receptors family 2 profile 2 domain-containing protein n=1 Tax=Basidiobolus ranarum TaxID=34480 RepID=A0ABR2VX56_9FUNG
MAVEWNQFDLALNVLNGISLGLCMFGFVLFLSLLIFRRKMVSRVSFRTAGVLLLVNGIHHISEILCRVWREVSQSCSIIAWLNTFTGIMVILLGTSIAYNLMYVYIGRQKVTKLREISYFSLVLLMSILLSLPGVFLYRYGYNSVSQVCEYITGDDLVSRMLDWFTLFGWLIFSITFSITVVMSIKISIRKKRLYSHRNEVEFQSLVQRVGHYPLLTGFIGLIRCIISSNRDMPTTSKQFSYVVFSVQGILYLILFLLDPDIKVACKDIREEIVYKYEFRREIHPQGNHQSWFRKQLRKLLRPLLTDSEELYIYSVRNGACPANRESYYSVNQLPTIPMSSFSTSRSLSYGQESVDSLLRLPSAICVSRVITKSQEDELFRMV